MNGCNDNDEVLLYTNPQFSDQFFKELRTYFITQKFTDITLKCDEKTTIKCHRLVLASLSSYFSAMLTQNFTESQTSFIDMSNLGDLSSNLMDIIDYAYCGSINFSLNNVKNILLLSSLFQIDNLTQASCNYWLKNINDYNCLDIFTTSTLHNLTELEYKSKEYMHKYFNTISLNDYFLQCDFDILSEFLMSDELNVNNEETLLILTMKWVSYDYDHRCDSLAKCLNLIRFNFIDPGILQDDTLTVKYNLDFKTEKLLFDCRSLISDLIKQSLSKKACKRAGMTVADECFVIVGGNHYEDDAEISNYSNCLNPRTLEKSFISANHNNIHDLSHIENPGVCVTQENRLFMAGGKYVCSNRFYLSKELYEYDSVYDTWSRRSNMLFAKSNFSMCSLANRIYTFGGITIDEDRIDIVEYYDLDESKWTYVCSMPQAFISGQVIVSEDRFYVMGGRAGVGRLNSCFTFDPSNRDWTQLSSMRVGRFNFGACLIENKIYVVGGQRFIEDDSESLFTRVALNSVEIYDIKNDQWSIGPSSPQPIYNTSFLLCPNHNKLFVLGTIESRSNESNLFGMIFTSLYSFDYDTGEWSLIENDVTDIKSNYYCVSIKINTRKLHKFIPKRKNF